LEASSGSTTTFTSSSVKKWAMRSRQALAKTSAGMSQAIGASLRSAEQVVGDAQHVVGGVGVARLLAAIDVVGAPVEQRRAAGESGAPTCSSMRAATR
jgi:hypothetical protein